MRKLLAFLYIIILFKVSNAQDAGGRFEFGSTIVTWNSFSSGTKATNVSFHRFDTGVRPTFELINGLFFRYSKNRLAIRVQTSYSDFSSAKSYTSDAWPYGPIGGAVNNKDFRIGAGAQYAILKQVPCMYTSVDIAFRRVTTSGHSYGDGWFARKFTSISNGAEFFIAVGYKITLIKNFILSPEIGFNTSVQFIKTENIVNEPNMIINNPNKFTYSQVDVTPILKLHLTAKF